MNQIDKQSDFNIIESVLTTGDLSRLTEEQRVKHYFKVCEEVGVNPYTRPFEYMKLNGKLVLYARPNCADQLRKKHKVSVEDLSATEQDGVYVVTARVRDHEGRMDISRGAVAIKGLQGDAKANAVMKAETKAKRRATFCLCGLGMLDESELETIPPSQMAIIPSQPSAAPLAPPSLSAIPDMDPTTGEIGPRTIVHEPEESLVNWSVRFVAGVKTSLSIDELHEWRAKNQATLDEIRQHPKGDKLSKRIEAQFEEMAKTLAPAKPAAVEDPEEVIRIIESEWNDCDTPEEINAVEARFQDRIGHLMPPDQDFLLQLKQSHIERVGA